MTDDKTKLFTKKSEQYGEGNVPQTNEKLEIARRNGLVYFACKNHGALLAYKNNVYRCIECGWAIERRLLCDTCKNPFTKGQYVYQCKKDSGFDYTHGYPCTEGYNEVKQFYLIKEVIL